MKRPTIELLSSALLATLVCMTGACDRPSEAAEIERSSELQAAEAQLAEASREDTQVAQNTELDSKPAAPSPESRVVLASATDLPTTSEVPSVAQPEQLTPKTHDADSLRHPSLLPTDTPAEHIAAFTRLPLAKRDKAPVAGVGASGIHLDELELGTGWAASRCEDTTSHFELGAAERVNLCFRVIHPREAEQVSVEWARDGKLRQVIRVGVKASHSYRTRAWLPVTEGRAGQWTATVKSEDGSVLGQASFEIGA